MERCSLLAASLLSASLTLPTAEAHGSAGLLEEPFYGDSRLFVADSGHRSVRAFDLPHLNEAIDTEVPATTLSMGWTPDYQFLLLTRGRENVDQPVTVVATGVGVYPWERDGFVGEHHLHRPFISKSIFLPGASIGGGVSDLAYHPAWKRFFLWSERENEMYLFKEKALYPNNRFKFETFPYHTVGHVHIEPVGDYIWLTTTAGGAKQLDCDGNILREITCTVGHGGVYDEPSDRMVFGCIQGALIIDEASTPGGGSFRYVSAPAGMGRYAAFTKGVDGVYYGSTDSSTAYGRIDGLRGPMASISSTGVDANGTYVTRLEPKGYDGEYFLMLTDDGVLHVHDGIDGAEVGNVQVTTDLFLYDEYVDAAVKPAIATLEDEFIVTVPNRGHLVHGFWDPSGPIEVERTVVVGGRPTRAVIMPLPEDAV